MALVAESLHLWKTPAESLFVSRLYGITTATPAALGQTGGDFLAVPRGRTGLGWGWMRNPGGGGNSNTWGGMKPT